MFNENDLIVDPVDMTIIQDDLDLMIGDELNGENKDCVLFFGSRLC